ncbi:MAG: Gfo/Idh/MocA family oxidoreductase [Tannerellaceae bacterium]|jgi:predicted dehydrogenase|nr:Gfo/Idh/MocA family oxidoreductase [Tannerellaceae bacterium]
METIKWGIIGAGDVCERKSGPAFYKTEHSALVAVMRRDETKARDYALRHGVASYYTDAGELLRDPEVGAVYIATPPDTHKDYTLLALEAGKPVYVEKPMALNYEECRQMIVASESAGQKLFVAYYRRALPYFIKLKELLEAGAIGRALTVDVRFSRPPLPSDLIPEQHTWRVKRAIAGEGYFFDLAPHTLDILDFLLGEVEEAKGFAQNLGGLYEVKDTVSAVLQFRSGVVGTGLWCFVAPASSVEDHIRISGTKGELCFNTFAFQPIRLTTAEGLETFRPEHPEHIQQPLIRSIVGELLGTDLCPSTARSASRCSQVMDWIMAPSGHS